MGTYDTFIMAEKNRTTQTKAFEKLLNVYKTGDEIEVGEFTYFPLILAAEGVELFSETFSSSSINLESYRICIDAYIPFEFSVFKGEIKKTDELHFYLKFLGIYDIWELYPYQTSNTHNNGKTYFFFDYYGEPYTMKEEKLKALKIASRREREIVKEKSEKDILSIIHKENKKYYLLELWKEYNKPLENFQ